MAFELLSPYSLFLFLAIGPPELRKRLATMVVLLQRLHLLGLIGGGKSICAVRGGDWHRVRCFNFFLLQL